MYTHSHFLLYTWTHVCMHISEATSGYLGFKFNHFFLITEVQVFQKYGPAHW